MFKALCVVGIKLLKFVVIAEVGIVQHSADNNSPSNGDYENSHHKHYSNQDWVSSFQHQDLQL
jgi:hypothetical protein